MRRREARNSSAHYFNQLMLYTKVGKVNKENKYRKADVKRLKQRKCGDLNEDYAYVLFWVVTMGSEVAVAYQRAFGRGFR